LTLAWNGETIEAAAPAALPPSILESVEYKRWLRVGDGTQLVGKDPKGNRVVATALGMVVDAKGTRRPLITSIRVFLPDGTLINETSYTPEGLPMLWTIYDTNATKIQRVVYRTDGLPGAPFIRQVRFFSPDGTAREYRADNPEQIVWGEWALDPEGSLKGKINGGREELVAEFIKQKEVEPGGAVNRSQPIRADTNSTSSAAGSRR